MIRRLIVIVGAVFAPVGIILLVVCAVTTTSSVHFRATATSTTGTVVDVASQLSCSNSGGGCTTDYYPVVRFTATDGRQITFRSHTGTNSRPAIGKQVTVLYQAGHPEDARLSGFVSQWLAPLITGVLGIVFTGVGLLLITVYVRRRRIDSWLEANGTRVEAEVIRIARNPQVEINRVNPWQVFADWVDPTTGQHHTFASENFMQDPAQAYPGLKTVQVLIDPSRPDDRYRMILQPAGIIG
ncbi:hypothetical protein GCM10011575_11830 [Microlunatus endophyticus]|uniref:DUF3592 domain-containing protein n=1 Tax=Microlunatus endophyticus TaxID=1716077 RepID=A0A917W0V5_9ACTN|nr:DUF3592 domain-containing protein [Microlunatus endophyticus]GGL55046.1 hypothetical protein GCM10011575_11830 [Microlunatus endophyticus]